MTQYDINFREYWRILKKRRTLVIFITLIFSIFFTIFAYLKAPTPIYTTDCLIEFERSPALDDFRGNYGSYPADDIDTQITMVKSYGVFEKVVEKLGFVPPKNIKENGHLREIIIATIENLRAKVEVERDGISSILIIKVTDTDPAFAKNLANTIALAYKETHATQQTRRNSEQLKYIVSQLEDVRKKLRKAEDEVNRFTKENELISIDLQSEKLLVKSEDLKNRIQKLEEDEVALERVLFRLDTFIKHPFGPDHNFYSTAADTQYQSTNDAMVGLILKRDTLLKDFTPKHPDVMAISAQIIENIRKMSFLLQAQIMNIKKKEADLKKNLKKVNRQTMVLMEKRLEFDRLKRKLDRYDEMMVLLERKNQEALIKKAEKPEIVNIVKPALLPTYPINSRNTMSAGMLSVVIGVVLGFVIAFIVETFDTSLGAIEDVEETLGTKVLGVIPQGDTQQIQEELMNRDPEKFKNYSGKHAVSIISHFFPKSMISESFRALRTNIQYMDPGKKTKTLAVTSSSPEEGKSMVASNLAITMAQGGMKTLLVGSDLRKPGIDKAFGVDRSPGLTDILIGDHPWRNTVKTVTDIILGKMSWDEIMLTPGLDNLHIITSGTPPQNPAELIDSKRLDEFIEAVKKEYDVVIFDSSPILSTADAAILGMKVDGVLLVYRVGSISKGLLKRTASQLEQVQCNLMGVVVNGINPDISPDFQGYKYYKYYYSYGEGKNGGVNGRNKQIKRPLMMFAAIVCLSVGFLWQSGLITSLKRSIRGTPQPDPITFESNFRQKTIRMDIPFSFSGTQNPSSGEQSSGSFEKHESDGPLSMTTFISPTAYKSGDKATVEQAPPERPPVEAAALLSALFFGMANKTDIKQPEAKKEYLQYPYSIQLGAYRTLDGAKKAVAQYRGKGLSAYWSKIDLNGNERWFRVYAGFFENRAEARRYKDEQNLVKSLVKKTPKNAFKKSYTNMPVIGGQTLLRMPNPMSPGGTSYDTKSSVPLSPKPVPVGFRKEGHQEKIRLNGPEFKTSASAPSGNNGHGVAGSMPEPRQSKAVRTEGKAAVRIHPTAIKPNQKASLKQTPLEKPPVEMAVPFSAPFLRGTSLSGVETREIQEDYPQYPYSIQLGAFRTLVEAQNAVTLYREKGLSTYWGEVDLEGNERWFRVYTGFFKDHEEAREYIEKQNLEKSIIKETSYGVLVGTFTDPQVLEVQTLLLNNLDYMPYAIREKDGKSRLLVGAFLSKKVAEEQQRILESKGIQSQVIKR